MGMYVTLAIAFIVGVLLAPMVRGVVAKVTGK